MAKTLQVRDVPEDVHARLRAAAAATGLSLSDYVLRSLTELASRPSVAEVLRTADERSGGAERAAILEAVRGVRDERP